MAQGIKVIVALPDRVDNHERNNGKHQERNGTLRKGGYPFHHHLNECTQTHRQRQAITVFPGRANHLEATERKKARGRSWK